MTGHLNIPDTSRPLAVTTAGSKTQRLYDCYSNTETLRQSIGEGQLTAGIETFQPGMKAFPALSAPLTEEIF